MQVRAGTSGFSYKEWKGPFYPEKLPAKDMLGFYAGRLPAVEINNTFYRMPKESVVAGWAEQVPPDFRFVIKASRRITHFKRLKEAGDETGYLLQVLAPLGERLGAVLFQLPPNLPVDRDRLERFLDLLPAELPSAFEFRHPSWRKEEVLEALRARHCAWVMADTAEDDAASAEAPDGWIQTGDLVYLRLRRSDYDEAALLDWAERLLGCGAERALVFFKHEDEGAGPRMAAGFLEQVEAASARRRPRAASATTEKASRKTGS